MINEEKEESLSTRRSQSPAGLQSGHCLGVLVIPVADKCNLHGDVTNVSSLTPEKLALEGWDES